jgi:SAM-dependent methyltransferase
MTDTELPADTAAADLPTSLTRLVFHGPLSQARATWLVERLSQGYPRTILDIGCGWGELMLRLLQALPAATGTGLDTDQGDLDRAGDNARARGLADRATFLKESAVGTTRGPADLVLCIGASHAVTDVQPPGLTAAALTELRRLVSPGGRVLLGEGIWERPPSAAELAGMWPDTTAADFPELADLVDLAIDAGFRPAWIEIASLQEWDDFESGYQCDEEEWGARPSDPPPAPPHRPPRDQHRAHWLRGYRGILGMAYLTLVPVT